MNPLNKIKAEHRGGAFFVPAMRRLPVSISSTIDGFARGRTFSASCARRRLRDRARRARSHSSSRWQIAFHHLAYAPQSAFLLFISHQELNMALAPSPVSIQPTVAIDLLTIGPGGRVATFDLVFAPSRSTILCSLEAVQENLTIGPVASLYINNTDNPEELVILFADSNARNTVPPYSAPYILAPTNSRSFYVSCSAATATAVQIQAFNRIIDLSGTQPVVGSVNINAGNVTVDNPGPVGVAAVDYSRMVGGSSSTMLISANPARNLLMVQCPITANGWIDFTHGSAGPSAAGSFYMGAGSQFTSQGAVPTGDVFFWLEGTLSAMVTIIEGSRV